MRGSLTIGGLGLFPTVTLHVTYFIKKANFIQKPHDVIGWKLKGLDDDQMQEWLLFYIKRAKGVNIVRRLENDDVVSPSQILQ